MAAIGRYDSDLQMFVEEPRDVQRAHLRFLRWLVERQDLEHPAAARRAACLPRRCSVLSRKDSAPRRFGRRRVRAEIPRSRAGGSRSGARLGWRPGPPSVGGAPLRADPNVGRGVGPALARGAAVRSPLVASPAYDALYR